MENTGTSLNFQLTTALFVIFFYYTFTFFSFLVLGLKKTFILYKL